MKKALFTLIITFYSLLSYTAEVNYEVAMPQPHTHYFEVKMNISNYQKEYFDIQLPVWSPGSYLVREFSKSIEYLEASFNELLFKTEKINKNTWRIYSNKAKNVTISYKVYAAEMSVRTSFLDASHGYFNGTSMFMFIDELKNSPSRLTIYPYKEWKKISTSLPKVKGETFQYLAPNYDVLVDCPVEIGNQTTFDFNSAGVLHHVSMYGKGNYNIEKLKIDMAKITQACTDVYGLNPNKEYTFIIHNLTRGSGGLEHLNSTTLQVNRWTYSKGSYKGFLSLVAHEYFHLWNVKRIRPIELGPFDYNNENYTSLLWVMEGFTSYYDELLLYRSGFYSEDEIIQKLNGSINYVENQPGNKVQAVAHASFDAWVKAYRPTENSYNTTISYYSKGSVIANMLDLKIISATEGKKSLDDVMQFLYNEYYLKKDRGFTSQEMQAALETVSGLKLDVFFDNYINGTHSFDYTAIFSPVNFSVKTLQNTKPSLGVSMSGNTIKRITQNSSAYDSGLNVNDEILAINGFRINKNISTFIEQQKVGDVIEILLSRDNIIQTLPVQLKANNYTSYFILKKDEKSNSIQEKWLQHN